jgi:hypothetical protein
MRKRKFFKIHSYGITAVLILTALMVLATPSNGFGGEWLPAVAYVIYLICDWHERRNNNED